MSETKPKDPAATGNDPDSKGTASKPESEKPKAKKPKAKKPSETKPKDPAKNPEDRREVKRLAGQPNIPSFDFDPKTKKPNLADGEEVLAEVEREGLKAVATNAGRKIWLCSIPQYEKKIATLTNRALWEKHFPHAVK